MVIKIGGQCAENRTQMRALASEMASLCNQGERMLLVHGGGKTVSELQRRYGITPRFREGLRETKPEEMPLVDMALCGEVNTRLVRLYHSRGVRSWGLSGVDADTIVGESRTGLPEENRTGIVMRVNPESIQVLWEAGYLPILAPVASDSMGNGLNINADEAALALAEALAVKHLIFLSDVPGVLQNGKPISQLTQNTMRMLIADGTIHSGMIPKVQSAMTAIEAGVRAVHIAAYTKLGDLKRIVNGQQGTMINQEGH